MSSWAGARLPRGSPCSAHMLVNTPNAPHSSLRLREVESSAVAIPDFQMLMGPLLELHE
jgi:hypothetical protein